MKKILSILLLVVMAIPAFCANPSFQSFSPIWFSTNALTIGLQANIPVTKLTIGDSGLDFAQAPFQIRATDSQGTGFKLWGLGGASTFTLYTNIFQFTNTTAVSGLTGDSSGNITGTGTATFGTFSGSASSLTNYTPTINSPNMARTLWSDFTPVPNNAGTETVFSTNTIPANTLGVNGNQFIYTICGTNNTGAASTLTFKMYFGTASLSITSTTTTAAMWQLYFVATRLGASSTDLSMTMVQQGGTLTIPVGVVCPDSTAAGIAVSLTVTSSAAASGRINPRTGKATYEP